MGEAYRGLTIRIGADTAPIERSMNKLNQTARALQRQFREVSKALKYDGGNAELQKLQLRNLGEQAQSAAAKIARLSAAEKQASAHQKALASSTKNATISQAYYHNQLKDTEQMLENYYDSIMRIKHGADTTSDAFKKERKALTDLAHEFYEGKLKAEDFRAVLQELGVADNELDGMIADLKRLNTLWRSLNSKNTDMKSAMQLQGARNEIMLLRAEMQRLIADQTKARINMKEIGGGSFREAYNNIKLTDSALDELNKDLSLLDKALKLDPDNIDAAVQKFRTMDAIVSTSNKKIDELQKRINMVRPERMAALRKEFGSLVYAVERVSNEFNKAEQRCQELENELREAIADYRKLHAAEPDGEKTKKAREHVKELVNELRTARVPARDLNETLDELAAARGVEKAERDMAKLKAETNAANVALGNTVKKAKLLSQVFASVKTLGYSMSASIGAGAMMAGMYALQAANDFDSSYRNMRKTVNGTEADFQRLRSEALEFSQSHWTSADQIMEIEAIGGQLDIASENLGKFAETVSNIEIATNLDAETIAENLGQLSHIMRDLDQDAESGPGSLEAYSDALVRLGNNSATQEDKIQNVMMRIASMGTISGMSTPDLLALSTAVAASGQGAEAAGTAISKTFSNIESAVNGGDAALKKIQETGDLTEDEITDLTESIEASKLSLRDFAQVAGMSSDEFKEAWNTSPTQAFKAFIEGLKRVDDEGGSVDATLKSLGINAVRQKQTLMNLTAQTEVYGNALQMSNNAWKGISDVWGDAGDAAREAERKAEGFSGQWKELCNTAKVLGIEITDSLTPVITGIKGVVGGLVDVFQELPGASKLGVSAFGGLLAISGPLTIGIGGALDGLTSINNALVGEAGAWEKVQAAAKKGNVLMMDTEEIAGENVGILTKLGARISDAGKNMEKANGKAGKLSNGLGKLGKAVSGLTAGKLFGITLGITAVATAVSYGIEKYQEYQDHLKMIETAHQTMSERIDAAMNSGSMSTKENTEKSIDALSVYNEYLEKCAEANTQLAESAEKGFAQSRTIDYYSNKINALMQKMGTEAGLTSSEYAELQASVKGFNDATGESLSVTKDETGAIHLLKDGADLAADAFDNLADSKRRAARASVYETEYQNLVNAVTEGQQKLNELQESAPNAIEEYTKIKQRIDDAYAIGDYQGASQLAEKNKEIIDQAMAQLNLMDDLRQKYLDIAKTEQMMALLSKDRKDMSDFEKVVADSDKLQSAFARSKVGVADFDEMLKILGDDASKVFNDKNDLISFLNEWDGTTQGLVTKFRDLQIGLDEIKVKAMLLNGVTFKDKTFTVDDKGSIYINKEKIEDFNNIQIDDQTYSLHIDTDNATASLESAEGEVIDLGKLVTETSDESELEVTASCESAKKTIEEFLSQYEHKEITVRVKAQPVTTPGIWNSLKSQIDSSAWSAYGNGLPNAHIVRHANGGYFVDKPTVIGRTGNVTHIAGEAGREFISTHARGGVVLPLSNPYMKPWVKAVANQMGGSTANNVTIYLAYDASSNATQIARDIGREFKLHGLMKG